MLVSAETILTETRETVEALTMSALQQAHEMSHRAKTTVENFFQAHRKMTVTVTSQEQTSSETARFPGEHESLRRGVRGRFTCWNKRHVWSLGGHDENANNMEIQIHRETFRRTSERLLRNNSNNSGHLYVPHKLSRQTRLKTGHELDFCIAGACGRHAGCGTQ